MKNLLAVMAAMAMFTGVSQAEEATAGPAETEIVKCDTKLEGAKCPEAEMPTIAG
jgi:hypothetical protein